MSVRRWSRLAARLGASLLVLTAVTALVGPGTAVPDYGVQAQEAGGETATPGTEGGSQIETAANKDDGGGLLDTVLGVVGGLVWTIAGFLDSWIGHALVGIPLGLYLGLKAIALYLEYYE